MTTRRYELLEELGRGGFGAVWRARLVGRGGFSREVAIKLLHASVTEQAHGAELLARLRDEARILGLLRHRAIVQSFELVQLEEGWAIVLELVEGADLGAFVSASMPVSVVWEIVAEVASGLHCALVTPGPDGRPLMVQHRDIKPQNLRLTAGGEVKILDLGIARAELAAREAETVDLRFGTLAYMSPERLAGVDLPAGDVYALGATAAELLLGEPLGRAQLDPNAHEAQIAARLRGLPLTAEERALLSAMLRSRPEDRPSAREVERLARAQRLARGVDAPNLLAWAEVAVPAVARRPAPGPTTPRALTERVSAPTPPLTVGLPPPPDRPRPSWAPWVFVGACLSLFVGGVGLLLTARPSAEAAPPELPEAAPAEAVVVDEVDEAPAAAPTPPPPRRAVGVKVTAATEGVALLRDGERLPLPATVAPGAYQATMSGWPAGTLSPVVIDGPSAVRCDRALRRCRVERVE